MNFNSFKKPLDSFITALVYTRPGRVIIGIGLVHMGLQGLGLVDGYEWHTSGLFSGGILSSIIGLVYGLGGLGFIFGPPWPPRKTDTLPASKK